MLRIRNILSTALIFAIISAASLPLAAQSKKSGKGGQRQEQSESKAPPSLTSDSAIASGTLANGMKYYIVTNSTETGNAEFALVRKLPYVADRDSTLRQARAGMADLERFKGRSSKDFLTGNGVYALPSTRVIDGGIVSVQDDAVVYRFGAMPVSARSSIVDSTLLMIFDIVEAQQKGGDLPAGYSTSDNAVIISGDVTKADILTKLNNLSLMVETVSVPGGEQRQYVWQPQDSMRCEVIPDPSRQAAFLTFSYISQRTPDKYMGTSLVDVTKYYGEVLGVMLRRRIETEMRNADIPLARVSCNYVMSDSQPGDERYEISVCVAPEDAAEACRVVACVIADIDNGGIQRLGYAGARQEYLTKLYISAQKTVVLNSTYVDKCLSAFLYGTTPVTDSEKWNFLAKGQADESSTKYFNNFAAKLLSGTRNLTLSLRTCDPDPMTAEELSAVFSEAYVSRDPNLRRSYAVNQSDTLSFGIPDVKLKVTSSRTDAISGGGTKWTFSNGMTVVYKRMDTQGLFYYNLLIRGGFASFKGLNKGGGAFLNDMLAMYNTSGVKGENFHALMRSNGIVVTSEVTVSDMSIYGVAMRPSLTLLLKAFTTFTKEGNIDRSRFDYYRRSELLRLKTDKGSLESRNAVIDSLFSPSYRYYTDKMASGLNEDVAALAEKFFRDQFSRVNDGVLVIVGDMNEDIMKRFLLKFIGGFPTSDAHAIRNRLEYSPVSGKETLIEDGFPRSIDVALSIPFSFTADNYMIMKVAELSLQDALNRRLAGKGAVARVRSDFFSYPQERAVMVVSVDDVDIDSLPEGERWLDHPDLLFEIGETLNDFTVGNDDLSMYKTVLKNQFKARQKDPWYWIHMVKTRVSDVKDINSKYSDKIDAVTADKVSALVSRLDAGGKVEYIVR